MQARTGVAVIGGGQAGLAVSHELTAYLGGFGAVIFTSGFRPDYLSWIGVGEDARSLARRIARDRGRCRLSI
jgi:hypothetical protein